MDLHMHPVLIADVLDVSDIVLDRHVLLQLPAGNNTVTQPSLSLGEIPANATLFPSERSPLYVAYEQVCFSNHAVTER